MSQKDKLHRINSVLALTAPESAKEARINAYLAAQMARYEGAK